MFKWVDYEQNSALFLEEYWKNVYKDLGNIITSME